MPCGGSGKARLGMCPNAQWMHVIKPALPVGEDRQIDHLRVPVHLPIPSGPPEPRGSKPATATHPDLCQAAAV